MSADAMLPRKPLFAAALLVGLAAATGADAQRAAHPAHGGIAEILASVQLSSAQKGQIQTIMHQSRTQNAPVMAQIAALHEQTEQTLFSPGSVTAAQLAPLVAREEALRQQLDASHLSTALAVRAVLTSTQLDKAAGAQAQLAALHQQERALTEPAGAAGVP